MHSNSSLSGNASAVASSSSDLCSNVASAPSTTYDSMIAMAV